MQKTLTIALSIVGVLCTPLFTFAAITYQRTPAGFYVGSNGFMIHLHSTATSTDFGDCANLHIGEDQGTGIYSYATSAPDVYFTYPADLYLEVPIVELSPYRFGPGEVSCDSAENALYGSNLGTFGATVTLEQPNVTYSDGYLNDYPGTIFSTFPIASSSNATTTPDVYVGSVLLASASLASFAGASVFAIWIFKTLALL